MTLEEDWQNLINAWNKAKEKFPIPETVFTISIYDLRHFYDGKDVWIDRPLKRLLDSEKYGKRIRLYGAPSSMFGKHPFKYFGKVWYSIRIKKEEVSGGSAFVGSQKKKRLVDGLDGELAAGGCEPVPNPNKQNKETTE